MEDANDTFHESVANMVTTNHVECLWRELKCAMKGTYKHFSIKYLSMYTDEIAFRLSGGNTERDMGLRIRDAFRNGIGVILTRRELVDSA